MGVFTVGDRVRMPGVPFVVQVLEVAPCEEPDCYFGDGMLFRFADPGGHGEDWAHVSEFELVESAGDGG